MKKIALITVVIALLAVPAMAELVYFHLNVQGGNVTAGGETAVTITARDAGNNLFAAYNGTVTLTAETGDCVFKETGTRSSGVFNAGQWTGIMILKGAQLLNTITVTDASGATGQAQKNVIHGPPASFQILTEGQQAEPGTATGYTGSPVALFTYMPVYVTVTAVDAYYNRITTTAMMPDARLFFTSPSTITPSGFQSLTATALPGSIVFTLTAQPVPDIANNYGITARNSTFSTETTVTRYFVTQNTYYLWPDINGVTYTASEIPVRAGTPFDVTIKASHYPREQGQDKIYESWDKPVSIKAVKYNNILQEALPIPTTPIAMSLGRGFTTGTYTKTDRIRIMPVFDQLYPNNNPGDAYVTKTASDIVQVYAAAPVTFTVSSDKKQLLPGQTAIITVNVFDAYANRVSRTAVNFSASTGSSCLSASTAITSDYDYANEGSGGTAQIIFTAPDMAGNSAVVTAAVPGVGSADIVIELVSSLGSGEKNKVKNTPNPFNPEKGGTVIGYYLEEDSSVSMKLYNAFGGLVWSRDFEKGKDYAKAGPQEYLWDGKTDGKFTVGVGLYTLKITVENSKGKYTVTRKIAVKK